MADIDTAEDRPGSRGTAKEFRPGLAPSVSFQQASALRYFRSGERMRRALDLAPELTELRTSWQAPDKSRVRLVPKKGWHLVAVGGNEVNLATALGLQAAARAGFRYELAVAARGAWQLELADN